MDGQRQAAEDWQGTYRGRRVLVTGHTGFKGGWLSLWLSELGAEVVGLGLRPEAGRPSFFEAAGVTDTVISQIADIRALDSVAAVFERYRPEIVFHLAAQSLVRESYRDPVATYATNVMGTVHVLDCALRTPSVRVIVNVTSDKCYEHSGRGAGFNEGDRLGGTDPYSASKAAAELISTTYRHAAARGETGLALATARAGNVIGGGDWSIDRLVPDIVHGLATGHGATIRNPSSTRPWQHVLDALRGYLMLGSQLAVSGQRMSGPWNFGPDRRASRTAGEIAEAIRQSWGEPCAELRFGGQDAMRPEAAALWIRSDKARRHLGWTPLLSFDEMIAWTVRWYRDFHDGARSPAETTRGQIDAYMARPATPQREPDRESPTAEPASDGRRIAS